MGYDRSLININFVEGTEMEEIIVGLGSLAAESRAKKLGVSKAEVYNLRTVARGQTPSKPSPAVTAGSSPESRDDKSADTAKKKREPEVIIPEVMPPEKKKPLAQRMREEIETLKRERDIQVNAMSRILGASAKIAQNQDRLITEVANMAREDLDRKEAKKARKQQKSSESATKKRQQETQRMLGSGR